MGITRRDLLRGLGGVALLAAGCVCPPRRTPFIEWTEPTGLVPLTPKSIQQKSIPLALDVHAHLFNGTDVHVSGYLQGPVAHSMGPYKDLIRLFAPILEGIVQSKAISCGEEMDTLSKLLRKFKGMPPGSIHGGMQKQIEEDIETHRNDIIRELQRRVPGSEFGDELDRAYQQLSVGSAKLNGMVAPPKRSIRPSEDPNLIRQLFEGEDGARVQKGSEIQGQSGLSMALSLWRPLTSPRHHNLVAYQKVYTSSSSAFGIDACFPIILDYDYWLGCPEPISSVRDQILLYEQLAVLSGGYVLPIVSYNPLSDIRRNGKPFELVKAAVLEHGFVGIKIYPPIGYWPIGNSRRTDDDLRSNELTRRDVERIDEHLRALYCWCEKFQVPLIVHTAHANGLDAAHDSFPGPSKLAEVAKSFPGLRIVAAHFGGNYRNATVKEDWPQEFAQLMLSEHGRNISADLSDASELTDMQSQDAIYMRDLLEAHPAIVERLMYGTDWHLLKRSQRWEKFPHDVQAFIASAVPQEVDTAQHAIFYRNAAKTFDLTSKDQYSNRSRLQAFYTKWEMSMPNWMKALGQA